MTKSSMVLVWSLLFVFSGGMAKGVVDTTELSPIPPAEKEKMLLIKNPLAKKVFQKYQSIKTYHAVWTMELDIPDPNITNAPNYVIISTWEVAFDRPTKRVLFFISTPSAEGKQSPQFYRLLLIADGKMMHFAATDSGKNAEIRKQSIPIADPNRLTYRDIREGMFIRPFDLPLMFSELHYIEVIENQIKEIKTIEPSESLLRFEVLPDYGDTSAVFWVDSKTLLIQRFNFDYHSGRNPVFKLKTIQVDQPLDDALFDFEKQLSRLSQ